MEAANKQDESYRFDWFSEVLKANETRDISEITERILDDVSNFVGDEKVRDDMTLVGVSVDK